MMRWLLLLLLACERVEAPPPPEPRPLPLPPIPEPIRVERLDRTVPARDDVVIIAVSPTEIWLSPSIVLRPITSATSNDDLTRTVRDTLATMTFDRGLQVIVNADKAVDTGRVVAILEGVKAAGFTKLAVGTAPP